MVDGLPFDGIALSLSTLLSFAWSVCGYPKTGVASAVFPRGAGKFTTGR
jgi:hypothetical protein